MTRGEELLYVYSSMYDLQIARQHCPYQGKDCPSPRPVRSPFPGRRRWRRIMIELIELGCRPSFLWLQMNWQTGELSGDKSPMKINTKAILPAWQGFGHR